MAHKEGLTWISRRTSQFRYAANGVDQWVQPVSVYVAGEDIKRGHLVSVLLATDYTPTNVYNVSDDDNVVVKTNTSKHLKACGIALEPATKGNQVHVLQMGKFTYSYADAANGYYPIFTNNDRGKLVYASPTSGELTLDRNASILGARNLIQVGYISNTTDADNVSFDVEIQFEGDGRGPLENTQFELGFGEEVLLNTSLPKVFAIGNDSVAAKAKYRLRVNRPTFAWPTSAGNAAYKKWIAFYSAERAVVMFMGPGSANTPTYSTPADGDRLNFITNQFSRVVEYVPLYGAGPSDPPPASWGTLYGTFTPDIYDTDGNPVLFANTIATILTNASRTFLTTGGSDFALVTGEITNKRSSDGNNTELYVDLPFLNNVAGGPIFVEWDSALNDIFVNSAYLVQGSSATAGKAILADRRFANRNNAIGLFIGTPKVGSAYTTSETGLFLRKGTFVSPTAIFSPGTRYFLGEHGQITSQPGTVKYPESLVEIGTAETTTELIVDICPPVSAKGVDYPIGSLKPLPTGVDTAEPGFVLMNGQNLSRTGYPELYEALCSMMGKTNIDVGGSGGTDFLVPNTLHPYYGNHYQIKATLFGYQPITTLTNRILVEGTVASGSVITADITPFKRIGPAVGGAIPRVEDLVINLFVEVSTGEWREIPSGRFEINSALVGYLWKVTSSGVGDDAVYTLTADPGTGGGIVNVTGPTTAVAMTGKNYRLVVYRPEIFARYYDVGAEVLNPRHNLPPTSIAVANYIDTSVLTHALTVQGTADITDKLDFHLDWAQGSHLGHDADARLEVLSHGVTRLSNTQTATNALALAGTTPGTNDVYLVNNAGTLEISPEATPADITYAAIKASAFQTVSTKVAKEGIKRFEGSAIDLINETDIVSFTLKSDPTKATRAGFIAEDTDALLSGPEHNQMDIGSCIGLLMKAVQELSTENKKLKVQLQAKRKKLRR